MSPAAFPPADAIVVGTGVAGLSVALGLAAAGKRVLLVTKTTLGGGSSQWAQGGVAAAMGPDDAPVLHAEDTLAAGAGLCDPELVALLTEGGPAAIQRLITLGTRFDRDEGGRIQLGREAAHSRRRILHAQGDATGAEIVRALVEAVRRHERIQVLERAFAWDILVAGDRAVGLMVLAHGQGGHGRAPGEAPEEARWLRLEAGALVMATGGCGQLFAHSTNPPEVTGDGIAMAARAGALLADMEFMQFHPTALSAPAPLARPQAPAQGVGVDPWAGLPAERMPLVTEALRGEGAVLIDEAGGRFMTAIHPQAELAPRDVVARAIWKQRDEGHQVYLDARQAVGQAFPERFPTVFGFCRAAGMDPRTQPIPVSPAAHYFMGGIAVDGWGRASLDGLWACGEAASSGLHGANRLASNSLLEALVFGARVADDIIRRAEARGPRVMEPAADLPVDLPGPAGADLVAAVAQLRRLMWDEVGLVRDAAGLRRALDGLAALEPAILARPPSPAAGEARNLLCLGRLMATAALARQESRGAHFRSDFPETDPGQNERTLIGMGGADIHLEPAGLPMDPELELMMAEIELAGGPYWRPEGWWR